MSRHRTPFTLLALATVTSLAVAACGVPEPPAADADPSGSEVQAAVPAVPDAASEPSSGDTSHAPAGDSSDGADATPEPELELSDALLEDGRFTLTTTRPTAPDPLLGAWDQPYIGARGHAGATCEAGTAVAWVVVATEHYKSVRGAWGPEDVTAHMAGGDVTMTATTPAGETDLVTFPLPAPEQKKVRYYFDLERLTDPALARSGEAKLIDYEQVRPGEIVGALVDTDPYGPPRGGAEWAAYELLDYYVSFELAAPSLPIPDDTEELTFTYELEGHEPAVLDVPVPEC